MCHSEVVWLSAVRPHERKLQGTTRNNALQVKKKQFYVIQRQTYKLR